MHSKNFLEKQKGFLLTEKERVEQIVKKLKKYPDYGSGDEDNLQEITEFEENLSLEEKMELLLKKINKALKSIESGTYGKCSNCKKVIEEGRLRVMPYAEVCVSCKNEK